MNNQIITLNDEEVEQLEIHAANYLTLAQLAEIMDIPEHVMEYNFKEKDSQISKIIRAERLKVISAINGSLITSAKNGSNPAQTHMLNIMLRTNNLENYE